jgi:hypothetical protein
MYELCTINKDEKSEIFKQNSLFTLTINAPVVVFITIIYHIVYFLTFGYHIG